MELLERAQRLKRTFDEPEDPDAPWYKRKKIILLIVIGFLVLVAVAVLFFGGYFAGISAYTDRRKDSVPEPESRVVLDPLEWDGVCPRKVNKCPSRSGASLKHFQGHLPLILVSLDGFHPSFMNRGLTPTIKNIAECGTRAPYMIPVFPTKTFPNHYSQVTGLYPPSHGIIDNSMYDPFKRKLFKVGQPESLVPSWWLKEPIWVTAQKQGKRTGCFYWPGSEVEINGTRPTYYKKYNAKVSFESRVDQILTWLDLPPSSRPHLLTLYVNQPDHTLHQYGVNSKQTNEALGKVDRMIERLFAGLQQKNLINCVNVIIMSDHGMSDTSCKRLIDIQNYINVNDSFITAGPFGRIRPKGRRNATIVNELVSKLRCKSPHMRVYPKEQLPVRYHYADNPRIEPIFLDLDSGWTVISKSFIPNDSICSGGAHGYDNLFPDMRATFLAHGPSFKKNFITQPFINVEVYEMLAELLGVSPNPNNGTRGSLHYIMTSPKTLPSQTEPEHPTFADVPVDEKEYDDRISASTCYCPESGKQMEVRNLAATQNTHLPFGVPYSAHDHDFLYLLYNEEYINAFHKKYKIPLWSSFTLNEQKQYNNVDENICWNGDARIPSDSTPKCADFMKMVEVNPYIQQRPLYPPGFSDSSFHEQSMLITNSIIKSLNHTTVLEDSFNEMLSRWVSKTGEINVVTGPAFDIFGTGIKPSNKEFMKFHERNGHHPISTHVFVVATWCNTKTISLNSCDSSELQAQGFLLPNDPYPVNCESAEDVIMKNVARIVDIENLTGLSFYKRLPIYDAIRLRTMIPERSF